MKYKSLINIDQWIKANEIEKARFEIEKLAKMKHNRSTNLELAQLARRVGLDTITLKLLFSNVRTTQNATENEMAEYALVLMRQGFVLEARKILFDSNLIHSSQWDLYRGFTFMLSWDYIRAIPFIEKYLECSLTDYDRCVATLNLISCETILDPISPNHLTKLKDLEKKCKSIGAIRIQANCYELMAQTYVYSKEYSFATKTLNEAEKYIKSNLTFEAYFIKKWRLFNELGQTPNSQNIIKKIINFRDDAKMNHFYEIARDCDFHLGIWNRSRSILQHLFFGTPYQPYRERIINELKRVNKIDFIPLKKYHFKLNGGSNSKVERWIDLKSGTNENELLILEPKKQNINLLKALSSDFYRPTQISSIFQFLFPDSYYDPFTSSNRIHQAVKRLRNVFKINKIPIEIGNHLGFFLYTKEDYTIIKYQNSDTTDPLLEFLLLVFNNQTFKLKDALIYMKLPLRSAQALLKKWVDEGLLVKTGNKSNAKYTFLLAEKIL